MNACAEHRAKKKPGFRRAFSLYFQPNEEI